MTSKGQTQKSKNLPKGLFEALRDMGSGVASDFEEQMGFRSPKRQNTNFPENFFPFEEEKKDIRKIFDQRLRQTETVRRQEKLLYSARDQEIRTKVTVLQQEVQKMATAVTTLATEVKVASFNTPVAPGIYHESFLERLVSFIKSLTKKVENASLWLTTLNAKAKKRPHYWAQVNKSGSKYMLSQERYMATQAG